jgi:hypothetical protein
LTRRRRIGSGGASDEAIGGLDTTTESCHAHPAAPGTYSHWNGYKVDVSPTTCVSSYITSHYAYYGVRSDGATMYRAASGNIYARESNHWDITYYTCGGC